MNITPNPTLAAQSKMILKAHLNGAVLSIIRAVIVDGETTLDDDGIRRGLDSLHSIVDLAYQSGHQNGCAEVAAYLDGGVSDDH